jgi:hypothetical protein
MHDHVFNLKSSRYYLILLVVLAVATTSMILYTPLYSWLKLLLIVFTVSYAWWEVSREVFLQGVWAVKAIRFHDGLWRLTYNLGETTAKLRGDSIVTRFVIVLRFELPSRFGAKSCVIFPDSLQAQEYRKLLVILRMSS